MRTIPEEIAEDIISRNCPVSQIDPESLIYQLFTEHSWDWNGYWRDIYDYHHFEKRTGGKRRNLDGSPLPELKVNSNG